MKIKPQRPLLTRRDFLHGCVIGAASLALPVFAEEEVSLTQKLDSKFEELLQVDIGNIKEFKRRFSEFIEIVSSDNQETEFIKWLNEKNEIALKNKSTDEKSKKIDIALEFLTRSLILRRYSDFQNHLEALLPSYLKLVAKYKDDPRVIKGGIDVAIGLFEHMNDWSYRSQVTDHFRESAFSFYGTVLDYISDLPKPEDINVLEEGNAKLVLNKDRLMTIALNLPQYEHCRNRDKDFQDKLADVISKHYFKKNHGDLYGLDSFITTCTLLIQRDPILKWSNYMAIQLVIDNWDYFKAGAEKLAREIKKSDEPTDELVALARLVKFVDKDIHSLIPWPGFPKIPVWGNRGWNNSPVEVLDEQRKIVRSKAPEIKKIAFNAALENFDRESVEVVLEGEEGHKKERQIIADSWRETNNVLKMTVDAGATFPDHLITTVSSRLNQPENPYNREMIYETLGAVPTELHGERYKTGDILRNAVITENTPQAMRGVGAAICQGINFEIENQRYFDDMYDSTYPTHGEFLAPLESGTVYNREFITPTQRLILDLVLLVEGYDKNGFIFQLLPRPEKFTNDYRMQLKRITDNAFLALAYSVRNNPNKQYVEAISKFLTKNFGISLTFGDPEKWGEKVAALFEVYDTEVINESKPASYFDDRIEELKTKLFVRTHDRKHYDSGTVVHVNYSAVERLENRKLKAKLESKRDSTEVEFNERRRDEFVTMHPDIKDESRLLKLKLAEGALSAAPHKRMDKYYDYLTKLGFDATELYDIKNRIILAQGKF